MRHPVYSQTAGHPSPDITLNREEGIRKLEEITLRAGLFHDPWVRAAMYAYALTGKPSIFQQVMRRCHATGFFKGQLRSRAFETPFSQGQVQGQVSIGRIIDTDFTYGFEIDDLTGHVFGSGATGNGKSIFLNNTMLPVVRNGHFVTFIDPKGGDFNGFVREGVLYLPWHEVRFNLLRPPEGVALKRWIPRLAESLSEPLGLLTASLGTLEVFLERTQARWEGKLFPCFKELADEIKSEARTYGKAGMYKETVENRIDTVTHTLSEPLFCRRGFMEELMHCSFILDISGLIGIAQNLLVECLMAYIYEWHRANVSTERPRKLVRAVCIDEAQHNVLAVGKAHTARASASGMEQYIALGRERGLAFIASAQSPSKILPEMINDAHLRVTFGLGSGEEIYKMGTALGLSREQTEMIQHLQVGQAIVRKSSGYTFPSLVQCFKPELPPPTKEDWQRNERCIKELQALAEPCRPEDTRGAAFTGMHLSENSKRLLVAIGEKPINVMMGFYQEAGLAGETGNKAKEQLIRAGYIQEEEIPGAGSGKTKSAWLKPDGEQAYRNISDKNPKKLLRTKQAGFAHDFWVNAAARFHKNQGRKFRIADQLGIQEADLVVEDSNRRTAYEVTLSLTNVQDKLKMLEQVDTLVFLYINETQRKEISKKLHIPDELKYRVEFHPLKEFLK